VPYIYSDPTREQDRCALPDVQVTQFTAEEAVEMLDEDTLRAYRKRFPLAGFNSRDRQRMVDAIIAEEGIEGGWFYAFCFPGCLPESDWIGPFPTRGAAEQDARDSVAD
jgi:hypothetical protein